MTTSSMASAEHLASGQSTSILSALALRLAEVRAHLKHRRDARRLTDQLQAMDDRLLVDIGLTEDDIARLRAGERFLPSLYQI